MVNSGSELILGLELSGINSLPNRATKALPTSQTAEADGCQDALRGSSLNRHGRREIITVISTIADSGA